MKTVFLAIALASGIGALVNGVAMILSGHTWYDLTPGVSHTGPYNAHFVIDIGIAFALSSAAWFGSVIILRWRAPLALAGAAFPACHGLFHALEWLHHGPPADFAALWTEALGVFLVPALGVWTAAAWTRLDLKANEPDHA